MIDSTSTCPDCGTPLPSESSHSLCPACLMRQALASRTLAHAGDKTPQLPPPSPEEIADHFPGYEVLECLGRGGMGAVYKARQKSLNRLVAIKILAPERVGEGRFAERFSIEAELLAKLGHPHIVTIHDFGETGGLFYLVMEFIDGVNLRDLLRDGKLESQQALAIVPPICDALQYAHDKGVVHRDIKPENILLDRDGRVKIADFGIASLVGSSGEDSGTPPYMAPEQSGGTVDRRADIYALGVVLYEMLTGERPEKDLIAPSKRVEVSVKIDEMVLRALEKEPERRYQTAGEFRTMVETIAATPPSNMKPERQETRLSEDPAAQESVVSPESGVKRWKVLRWASFLGILAVMASISGIMFMVKVVPQWEESLASRAEEVPTGMQLILTASHFIQSVWPLMAPLLLILGGASVAGFVIAAKRMAATRNAAKTMAEKSSERDSETSITSGSRALEWALLACALLSGLIPPLFFTAGQFSQGKSHKDQDNSGASGAGPIAHIKVESMDAAVISDGHSNAKGLATNTLIRRFENARTRAVYDWKDLATKGDLKDGLVVEPDGRSVLKIENSEDEPLQAQLLIIENPPVEAATYALRGEVRFEDVQGPAYFEMWSELSEGRFFSRTLGDIGSGPMSPMAGTSGWRSFLLPFDRSGTKNAPVRIELNLSLPGRGTVFVGALELIEVSSDGAAQNGVTDTPAILTGEEEAPNGDVLRVTIRTAKGGNGDGKSLICQVEGENVDFENLGDHLKSIIGKNKPTAVEIASEPDVIMERVMKVAGFVKEAGVEDLRFIALSPDAEPQETSRELTTIRATNLPADNRLQLRMVAPDDPQAIPTEQRLNDGSVRSLKLSHDVILSDQHVEDAGIRKGNGGYEVTITLNEAGGQRMAMATKGADGGMQIAILIDGEILSAPVIQMQLGRSFVISGLRDEKECLGLIRHLVEWPGEPDMAAMTEWLEQVDQGNFETAWSNASEYLRQNVTPEKWQQMMTTARSALGALSQREMTSAKRMDSLPGVPDGQYLITEFDSSLAEKKEAKELVTLHKEKDGRWRVIGYFIR